MRIVSYMQNGDAMRTMGLPGAEIAQTGLRVMFMTDEGLANVWADIKVTQTQGDQTITVQRAAETNANGATALFPEFSTYDATTTAVDVILRSQDGTVPF